MSKSEKSLEDFERFEMDASLAISGAEYIREKLASLVAMGPRPLYDEVYAIKLRTKSTQSLAKKVALKRSKEKPNYTASEATDIVGMRLLSLFASELPSITRSLLTFLRFCQSPQIALIQGENLNQAIREIIIYKSKQAASAIIYEKIYRFCKSQPIDEFNSDGTEKIGLIDFQETDKSYSSVHIVVNAVSYSGGSSKTIPVEIQIRSVFEDTWGEIDHKLEYKFKQLTGGKLPEDISGFYRNFQTSLRNLKDKLEDIGSDAELIRDGYQNIISRLPAVSKETELNPFLLTPVYISDSFEREIRLQKTTTAQIIFVESFDEIVDQAKRLRALLRKPIIGLDAAEDVLSEINSYGDSLSKISKALEDKEIFGSVNMNKLEYFLKMERSLCFTWTFLISDHFYPAHLEHNIGIIDESIKLYFELEKTPQFRNDAFLNYRLGCALVSKGKLEDGESFFYRAMELIPNERKLKKKVISAVIPHMMSFAIWLHRASLLEMGFKTKNVRINRENQLEIVSESLFWALLAQWFVDSATVDKNSIKSELKLDISNNIISFIWEMRDLSSDNNEFYMSILDTTNEVENYIENILKEPGVKISINIESHGKIVENSKDVIEFSKIQFSDTLMKYYQLIGDVKNRDLMYNQLQKYISDHNGKSVQRVIPKEVLLYSLEQVKKKGDSYALAKNMMAL